MTLQKPLKMDGTDDPAYEYPEPVNTDTDALAAAGFYPQTSGSFDQAVGVGRDSSGNLLLQDSNAGTLTLSQVAPGGTGAAPNYDFLLDCDPDSIGVTYVITRVSSLITQELWKKTSDNKSIKTLDYTRVSGLLTTEVTKLYGSDGVTVVAQKTVTYSRSGGFITGATVTRDI